MSDEEVPLLSRQLQESGEPHLPVIMTIVKAVKAGIVENETLGYYMARVHQFLLLGLESMGTNLDSVNI